MIGLISGTEAGYASMVLPFGLLHELGRVYLRNSPVTGTDQS